MTMPQQPSPSPRMTRGSTVPPTPVTTETNGIQGWDNEYLDDISEYPEEALKPMQKAQDSWKGYDESTQIYKDSETSPQPNMQSSPVLSADVSLIDNLKGFDIKQKLNIQNIISNEISDITSIGTFDFFDSTK
jgi:hypothetical protein